MKAHYVIRKGLNALAAILLSASLAFGQTLNLGGDVTGTGTTNANGNVNNTTASTITISGTLNLRGNSGTQGLNSSGGGAFSINRLDLTRNGNKELNIGVAVTDILSYGNASNVFNSVFDINAQTLSVANTTQIVGSPGGSAAVTFTDGTVAYTNATSQNIFNTNAFSAPITYGTLNLSGNANFTLIDATSTVTAATVSHTGIGTVTVNDDFTITGTGSFGTIATIAASQVMNFSSTTAASSITALTTAAGTLRKSGDQNLTITTVSDVASGGTIEHTTAGGTLTVATLSDNHGTIQSTSTGTVAFTNNITNNNLITTATGTLDFNGTGTQTNTSGTISVTGAGNALFAGDIETNTGTLTLAAASTVTYDGGSQSLATGVTYGNLVAGGSAAKSASANLTVGGNLTLTQNITQSSGSLTLTSTTAANVLGTGEVIGSLRRAHSFTSGSAYAFNRSNVQLTFGTTAAGDVAINMQPGDDPTSPVTAKYVQRSYGFTGTSLPGNVTAAKLYYSGTELTNVPAEGQLGIRTYDGAAWSKLFFAGYSRTATGGEVTLTSIDNSLAGVTELGLFQITIAAAASGNWASAATWDEGVTPTNDDDVEITGFDITVAADVAGANRPASLTLMTGSSLDLTGGSFATLGDLDVLNDATVTSAGGRTLTATDATFNTSGTSTLSGDIAFASLTNSAGTLNLTGGSVTNTISNASTLSVAGALTVSAGSATTSTQTAGSLTVSGASGNLTFGSSGVLSALTISSGSLTINDAAGQLMTFGDLNISSGVTVTNNGTITVGE